MVMCIYGTLEAGPVEDPASATQAQMYGHVHIRNSTGTLKFAPIVQLSLRSAIYLPSCHELCRE